MSKYPEWASEVDCDYLEWKPPSGPGADIRLMQPVCTKEGAPNYDRSIGPPFHEKCRECPENKATEGV